MERSDAHAISYLINNKKVQDNLRDFVPYPYTLADGEAFIKHTKENHDAFTFAITYNGELVGVMGLTPQVDVYRKSVEIGYWIGEPFWNKGIGTGALQLTIQHVWRSLEANRIFCGVYEYNIASMKILEKCGFQKEGIAQKAVFKNNQFWDLHRYALLK